MGMLSLLSTACGSPPTPTAPSPTVTTDVPSTSSATGSSKPTARPAPTTTSASGSVASGSYKVGSGGLELPGKLVYQTGTDRLTPESDPVLDYVAGFLSSKADVTLLRIEVHSDSQGNPAMNEKLTVLRSMAVAKALVERGIDCKRLIPVGFGDTKPVEDNSTPQGRDANRRTVFVPAQLRGRAIGGMPVDGGGFVAGNPCAP